MCLILFAYVLFECVSECMSVYACVCVRFEYVPACVGRWLKNWLTNKDFSDARKTVYSIKYILIACFGLHP